MVSWGFPCNPLKLLAGDLRTAQILELVLAQEDVVIGLARWLRARRFGCALPYMTWREGTGGRPLVGLPQACLGPIFFWVLAGRPRAKLFKDLPRVAHALRCSARLLGAVVYLEKSSSQAVDSLLGTLPHMMQP